MQEPNLRTLLVGIGNPLSGDDGFGPQTLELLRQKAPELPRQVSLADAHTDLLNHIEDFSDYDRVILIDAILDPEGTLGRPGTVATFGEEAFHAWPETSESVHQMSPMLAVRLFRTLYPKAQTKILLVGLLVDQLTHQPRYATEDRINQAVTAITKLVS